MRTYVAVAAVTVTHKLILHKAAYPNVLISYHYDTLSSAASNGNLQRNRKQRFVDALGYEFPNLMLDSGAFSVWAKGGNQDLIDLDGYIEWAKLHAARFPMARITNLDVIPMHKDGTRPSKKRIADCVKQSKENADAIREAGLRVTEVYHFREPIAVWEELIERRREGEVLGLGGIGKEISSARRAHGDAAFRTVRDICGWDAVPPIHAFAAVSSEIAWRYPLFSCDASTWVAPSRWGQTVNRRGRLRQRGDTSRLYMTDHAISECAKILTMWQKRDKQIDDHWRNRGVTILPEGPANAREPVAV